MKPTITKKAAGSSYPCLPPEIHPDTVVAVKTIKSRVGIRVVKQTVAQRLNELGARCRKGKLIDRTGLEVRFHQTHGCWGNPPADYLEILDNQKKELRELKKKFTVVEITCNPTGLAPF